MEILKMVINNKLRMVYFLIVYTVLLVQFPETKLWASANNKTWFHHCASRSWQLMSCKLQALWQSYMDNGSCNIAHS